MARYKRARHSDTAERPTCRSGRLRVRHYGRIRTGRPSASPAIPDGSQTGVPQFQAPELRNARTRLPLARPVSLTLPRRSLGAGRVTAEARVMSACCGLSRPGCASAHPSLRDSASPRLLGGVAYRDGASRPPKAGVAPLGVAGMRGRARRPDWRGIAHVRGRGCRYGSLGRSRTGREARPAVPLGMRRTVEESLVGEV